MKGLSFWQRILMIFNILFSIPKTLYANFRLLPLNQAIKLPLYINYDVHLNIEGKGNLLIIKGTPTPFMMVFGLYPGSKGVPNTAQSSFIIQKKGVIEISGRCNFNRPCSIRVDGGHLTIGNHFNANKNSFIACSYKISFMDNITFGWNVEIRDNDGHTILFNGIPKKEKEEVFIGNHCWVCSYAHLLKGSYISDESVVGYKSLITRRFEEPNILIAGHPGKIVQRNISWHI